MTRVAPYRGDIGSGARAMAPWLTGIVPLGLVIGVLAANSHLPTLAGWLTGPAIYAGSAQVTAIQMLAAGAAPVAVVATVLLINARLFFYSVAIAPHWRGTPIWWRLVAGYLLVDPSFVVGTNRYGQPGDQRRAHAHYLGAALLLWVTWLVAIAVGAVAGARLPAWLHLDFLVPLYLVGQVVPRLRQSAPRYAAVASAGVAAMAVGAPMQLGIPVGILVGIAAALFRRRPATATPTSTPSATATATARETAR
jgi:predicted branched-subunit amino acid permease